MNAKEAKYLLKTAPQSETKKAGVNKWLTQKQAFDIINRCIVVKPDDEILDDLTEKRVYQIVKNQRRPKY